MSAAVLVASTEVQERSRDGGGGKAAVAGGVAGAQAAADVQLNALDRATPWHSQRDHRGRGWDETPAPSRRAVAEEGALAGGQQSGDEMPFLGTSPGGRAE
jgi:hypothetical protein